MRWENSLSKGHSLYIIELGDNLINGMVSKGAHLAAMLKTQSASA